MAANVRPLAESSPQVVAKPISRDSSSCVSALNAGNDSCFGDTRSAPCDRPSRAATRGRSGSSVRQNVIFSDVALIWTDELVALIEGLGKVTTWSSLAAMPMSVSKPSSPWPAKSQ